MLTGVVLVVLVNNNAMTNFMLVIWLIIIIFFLAWVGICIYRDNIGTYIEIPFKESIDLTKLPIVSFKSGSQTLHLLIDTGCTTSIFDETYVSNLPSEYFNTVSVPITSATGQATASRTIALKLYYKDREYFAEFLVCPMKAQFDAAFEGKVTVHGILGTDFFQKYGYDIDFEELKIYAK